MADRTGWTIDLALRNVPASSPEVEGASGGYYSKCKLAKPTAAGRDDEAARRLWELSEGMVHRGTE
jgi:hypothetical protein